MARIDHSVVIERPVHDVWALFEVLENAKKWQSGLQEVRRTSEEPIEVGSTWVEVRTFLGRSIETTFEITSWEPNQRFAAKSASGPIEGRFDNVFEEVDGGTKVSVSFEAEFTGFFKLAEALVVRRAKSQIITDHEALKELLESGD